jgi:protein kinase-like protein
VPSGLAVPASRLDAGADRLSSRIAPKAPRSIYVDPGLGASRPEIALVFRRRGEAFGYFWAMTAWPEELPRGFEFERFEILDCVSRGSVAAVYRAQSAKDGVVALKVFDRSASDRLPDFRRLSKNVRAAAVVRHPNVAAIFEVGVWQERSYLITEWLEGCDLRDYLDRWGVMAQDEVAELGLHLISGLLALHQVGATHGDIKPSSIFLCNGWDGDVIPKLVLADLAHFNVLASAVDSTTRDIAISTPAYTPPEAVRRRVAGPKADQYSLGAVLYECAVGRPPFVGDTLLELLRALAAGEIQSPRSLQPELSEQFEAALLKALRADPEARFETSRDLGRALWPLASERAKGPWAGAFGGEPGARPTGGDVANSVGSASGGAAHERGVLTALGGATVTRRPAALLLLAASIALSIGIGAFYFYSVRGADTRTPRLESEPPGSGSGSLGVRSERVARASSDAPAAQPVAH